MGDTSLTLDGSEQSLFPALDIFSALCSVTQLRHSLLHSLDTDLRKKCHNAIGAQVSHRGYTLKYPAHCRLSPWYDTRIN